MLVEETLLLRPIKNAELMGKLFPLPLLEESLYLWAIDLESRVLGGPLLKCARKEGKLVLVAIELSILDVVEGHPYRTAGTGLGELRKPSDRVPCDSLRELFLRLSRTPPFIVSWYGHGSRLPQASGCGSSGCGSSGCGSSGCGSSGFW